MYKEQLTQDYIENITIAAPMHDVGKIAIPDAILQKPGRLTDEEFAIMRTHAEKGGEIIKETFGHIGDGEYEKMAYEVARYHHEKWNGKIETTAKSHVNSREDLAIAYTPGVAEPCKVIAKDPNAAYKYTMKANTIAVVSDGSAVLGLGNIGAKAAMPVMEGKAVLFKEFGGVNAVPICLDTQDTEEIIKTVVNIAPAFGGINLEDISAPRCFEIEERLKELLDIPVFHDDQHGTAIVVLAVSSMLSKLPERRKKTAALS